MDNKKRELKWFKENLPFIVGGVALVIMIWVFYILISHKTPMF